MNCVITRGMAANRDSKCRVTTAEYLSLPRAPYIPPFCLSAMESRLPLIGTRTCAPHSNFMIEITDGEISTGSRSHADSRWTPPWENATPACEN